MFDVIEIPGGVGQNRGAHVMRLVIILGLWLVGFGWSMSTLFGSGLLLLRLYCYKLALVFFFPSIIMYVRTGISV